MARKAVGTTFGKFGDKERAAYLELRANGVGKLMAAKGVGVSDETVRQYAKEFSEWDDLDRTSSSQANEQVVNAMFQTALKGNVTAQQVWLYNRAPDEWKDRRKPDAPVPGGSIDLEALSPEELQSYHAICESAVARSRGSLNGHAPETNGAVQDRSGGICTNGTGHHAMGPDSGDA